MNQELRNRVAETVIVSAALVAAWVVLAQPGHAKVRESGATLAHLEAETERFESSYQLPPDRARVLEDRIERLLDLATPRAALEQHEQILALARTHALDVERINPGQGAQPVLGVGPIRISSRRIHVEVTGAFADVCAFLSALTCEAPMTVIEHFAINARSGLSAEEVTLSAWIKIGGITVDEASLAEAQP